MIDQNTGAFNDRRVKLNQPKIRIPFIKFEFVKTEETFTDKDVSPNNSLVF